jgi:hypothetical protein
VRQLLGAERPILLPAKRHGDPDSRDTNPVSNTNAITDPDRWI